MGVFDDKRYEELDWISQATEPIESPLNDHIGRLPDEMIITSDMYLSLIDDSYDLDVPKDKIIKIMTTNAYRDIGISVPLLSWDERDIVSNCFEVEFEGEPVLNLETRQIENGQIKILKTMFTLDEKILENVLGSNGLRAIKDAYRVDIGRMNEILELLGGAEEALRSRSFRKKKSMLISRVSRLMKDNEWNIKSADLADKVGTWIASYIATGNLAAMSNFCRLKVMTHKGLPIYSMEEVQ